jgi:serralysin
LKYGGAAFEVQQFGWTAIDAEKTAGGYKVAWRVVGTDQYTVWNVDSSGNFVSNTMGVLSGPSHAL